MKKASKKDIYAEYGIQFENGKIYHEKFGWINPLLIDGNSKLGKGVWTFSTLPGNMIYHIEYKGMSFDVKGTCACNCNGCYAQTGFFRMKSTINSLAIKTWLVWNDIEFVNNAIKAQIKADDIKLSRIHASGDFASMEYVKAWQEIVKECSDCIFWTYTKVKEYETMFDDIANINIVKSCIPGFGFNYGHCNYILKVYKALKDMGKNVYICRCGIDANQHCTNCKGCSKNEYVLFIEHSTSYKAENDVLFPEVKKLIESQSAQ